MIGRVFNIGPVIYELKNEKDGRVYHFKFNITAGFEYTGFDVIKGPTRKSKAAKEIDENMLLKLGLGILQDHLNGSSLGNQIEGASLDDIECSKCKANGDDHHGAQKRKRSQA